MRGKADSPQLLQNSAVKASITCESSIPSDEPALHCIKSISVDLDRRPISPDQSCIRSVFTTASLQSLFFIYLFFLKDVLKNKFKLSFHAPLVFANPI